MANSLLNTIFAAVDFAFDLWTAIDRTKRLSKQATGSDQIIDVPADPKPLPPAARRALAEAEERERVRERAAQTASGTSQAS